MSIVRSHPHERKECHFTVLYLKGSLIVTAYITATFFFKKKAGLSDEEFYRHWGTTHANLAISCKAFTVSVRRYVQVSKL